MAMAVGLSVYPASDTVFRATVERSFSSVAGSVIDDPAMLSAMEALLRPSYPLAKLQRRGTSGGLPASQAWDAFRDATVLDDELLRRARAGEATAVGQLYDRHVAVAYSIAARLAGQSEAASAAVVSAVRSLTLNDDDVSSVRVRVARAARDAALRSAVGSPPAHVDDPLTAPQRAVLELAQVHRFLGDEIAAVLRLDIREVRRLADEGLGALARARRRAGDPATILPPPPRLAPQLVPPTPEPSA
jgi:DNA-directed RNA polymerase specialized sigma24 family protein